MKTIGMVLIGALLLSVLPSIGLAEVYEINRHKTKTYPDGKPCKEKDYWSVTQTIECPVIGYDRYKLDCTGCGSTVCEIMKKPRLISTSKANSVLEQAINAFTGGQLTGGILTTEGDRTITVTWVGQVVGDDEVQNIRIAIQ